MSVFVNPKSLMTIEIRYTPIMDEFDMQTGVRIVRDTSITKGVEKVVCKAKGRNFDVMSKILEDCTVINHITGKPMLRNIPYYRAIILNFFTAWGKDIDKKTDKLVPLTDDEGNPMPLNETSLGLMHDSVVKAIAREWLCKTG